MKEPELAEELVRAVGEVVADKALVTIKIRSGWDEESKNAPEFALKMVEAGAKAVTVHGRTRAQAFKGKVDLESIAQVKQAVTVPVIGNGDVVDIPSLERMIAKTKCDGVMIGRAALGNPWIFSLTRAWWCGEDLPAAPSTLERLEMYLRHLDLYLAMTESWRSIMEMRKFAGWYIKAFPGAAALRKQIYGLDDVELVRKAVEEAMRPLQT